MARSRWGVELNHDLRVPREIMMFHFVPSVLKTLEIHHSTLKRVGDNLFNKQYLQKDACLFEIEQANGPKFVCTY